MNTFMKRLESVGMLVEGYVLQNSSFGSQIKLPSMAVRTPRLDQK